MKKLKELASDTLIYGISSVLARFLNYLLVPFHTDVFRTDQYGVVGLVYAGITFLNVIFTFGMESAYLRYAKDREEAKNVFKTLQLGLLGMASLLTLLLWVLAPHLMPLMSLDESTASIYMMILGILWFDTLSIVPFAELRLVRRSLLFAILKVVHVVINLALNFYLILVLNWGIEAVFAANLVASAGTTLALWVFTLPMLNGSWRTDWMRKGLIFGLPFVPAGIGYAINEMLDRFFLNEFLPQNTINELYGPEYTPEDIVGIYNACYKLAVLMLLFVQMFRMAWQPFFMRHADDEDSKTVYREVFRYFNLVAAVIFLGIVLFIDQIVQIRIPVLDATIIGESYWMGLHIVPLLLGAYWFHGWYMNFSAGIFIREQTRVLPVITLIGAIITVVFNLVLIPELGMMGSATATILSYSIMALLLYRESQKVYPVSYPMKRSVAMMIWVFGLWILHSRIEFLFETEWTAPILLFIIGTTGLFAIGISSRSNIKAVIKVFGK